jgi:hypothetical protein
MTTISVFTKLLFGPNPGSDHIVKTSLEAPVSEDFGEKYLSHMQEEHRDREEPEHRGRHHVHHDRHAPPPAHRPHEIDHHHHRPHARVTDHHHQPHEKETGEGPRASIRAMTPEELKGGPDRKETGHHHRPFDKGEGGQGWAPHMDKRGFVPHQKVKAALIKRGFSPEDASAITGNLIYESGGNQHPGHPVILNPATGGHSGSAAFGAAQWEGSRKAGLKSPSLDDTVEHIWNEMHGSGDPGAAASYKAMGRAKTVAEKAHIVNAMYERPKWPRATAGSSSDRGRIRLAEEVYRGRDRGGDLAGVGRGATPSTGGSAATGDANIPLSGGAASRKDSLSGMQPEFRARLAAMFRDAPPGSSVFSGYRSPELQAQLYNQPHRAGYVARPGHSHHGMGDAADISGNLAWFHKHAHEYGLHFPMSYENWHIQADPNATVPVPGATSPTRAAEK